MSILKTSSFTIDRKLLEDFRRKCPNHGDRTRIITEMIRQFLDGKIVITFPRPLVYQSLTGQVHSKP